MQKVKCNLCGSSEEKILFSTNYGNIVQCRNCGLVYRNPRLPEKNGLSHYIQSIEPHYERVNLSKEKLFRSALKFLSFQFRITQLADHLITQSPKLLDVGCSDGFFLQLAQKFNFDVCGVEVSRLAVDLARQRGLEIFEGTLNQANFPNNIFDVVTIWDVCEELSDPLTELREIYKIISKNGLVLIRTRNSNFHVPVHRIFHRIASYLKISPTVFHQCCFSKKTIKMALEKVGFQKVEIRNSKPTVGDPYSGGKIFGHLGMRLIKYCFYFFCQSIYYLSGKKLVLAPSMLVFARK